MLINKAVYKTREFVELKKRKKATKKILDDLVRQYADNEEIKKIAVAIDSVLEGKAWEPQELDAFRQINALAKKYIESEQLVAIKDYGAGKSESNREREEMITGKDTSNTVSRIYRSAASKEKWGKLIFKLVREFRPENCLELGTSLGMSASYQIFALKLNGKGALTTIEGSEEIAKIADENLKAHGYSDYSVKVGRFNDVLPTVLNLEKPIDFVFIDGHHDKDATWQYFEMIYPYLKKKAVLIFDDINWSKGMQEVWTDIYQDNRNLISFDLFNWGICLVEKDAKQLSKECFKIGI